jgi:hypothetical protein
VAGGRRGEQRLPGGDDADRREQLLRRDVLEQEPARPGPQRREHVLVHVERRQHQHPDTRRPGIGGDAPGGLDAIKHRHPDIHQHHIRVLPQGERDRLLPGGRLTGERHVAGQAELDPEAVAHQPLVIGDRHPHAHTPPSSPSPP